MGLLSLASVGAARRRGNKAEKHQVQTGLSLGRGPVTSWPCDCSTGQSIRPPHLYSETFVGVCGAQYSDTSDCNKSQAAWVWLRGIGPSMLLKDLGWGLRDGAGKVVSAPGKGCGQPRLPFPRAASLCAASVGMSGVSFTDKQNQGTGALHPPCCLALLFPLPGAPSAHLPGLFRLLLCYL